MPNNTPIAEKLGASYQKMIDELIEKLPDAYKNKTKSSLVKETALKYGVSISHIETKVIPKIKGKVKPPSKKKAVKKARYTEKEIKTICDLYRKSHSSTDIYNMKALGDRTPSVQSINDILRRNSSFYREQNKDKTDKASKYEKQVISLFENGLTIKDISKNLEGNVSRKTVEYILIDNGYNISPGKTWQEKLAICSFYYGYKEKDPAGATAKKFDCSKTTVRRLVREVRDKYGIEPRDKSDSYRSYSLNKNFFSTIDTEAKAYALGLIAADGSVNRSCLSIELNIKDKAILEEIKEQLESDRPLRNTIHFSKTTNKYYHSVLLAVQSYTLIRDLGKYGILPNKTASLEIKLDSLPENLLVDFWRGAVDGDGSLFKNSKSSSSLTLELLGTKSFCSEFKNFLCNRGIDSNIQKHYSIYATRVQKLSHVIKAVDLLYRHCSISLDRKRKIAFEWMSVHNESQ